MDGDGELVSRRCKAMSASFSVYSATESSVFNGSDSGSSSAGGGEGRGGEGGRGGVYENFRKELDNQAWVRPCVCVIDLLILHTSGFKDTLSFTFRHIRAVTVWRRPARP